MSDTKKLASPSFLIATLHPFPAVLAGKASGCDASSAQFCTHYYYLKVAFQQTFIASIIGPMQKEFVLFIAFESLGLDHEEKSRRRHEN